MKAITLHQPWATLIEMGLKQIETRDWSPPARMIGQRIAIHAGKRMADHADLNVLILTQMRGRYGVGWGTKIPIGVMVATAVLGDTLVVVQENPDGSVTAARGDTTKRIEPDGYGDFSVGRHLWMLEDIARIDPPVPARGAQKLWEWRDGPEEPATTR